MISGNSNIYRLNFLLDHRLSLTALLIASVVASILTTTPFLNRLMDIPNATISSLASLLYLPTIQTTFDVPISKPTIKLNFYCYLP